MLGFDLEVESIIGMWVEMLRFNLEVEFVFSAITVCVVLRIGLGWRG